MISENWIAIEWSHSEFKVRSNCIQIFFCTCSVVYDRQIRLVMFNCNSYIVFNGHVRLLNEMPYNLITIQLTQTTIKLMISLRTKETNISWWKMVHLLQWTCLMWYQCHWHQCHIPRNQWNLHEKVSIQQKLQNPRPWVEFWKILAYRFYFDQLKKMKYDDSCKRQHAKLLLYEPETWMNSTDSQQSTNQTVGKTW